jgi:uncharacterized membrane protein YhhN
MLALPVGAVLAVAAVDWVAVGRGARRVEYAAKPATMLVLIALALTLHPASGPQRAWLVAALVLGLAGDVCLMLPRDLFMPGLVAFLLGHLAYVAGFVSTGFTPVRGLLALVVVAAAAGFVLPRVLGGVRARKDRGLVPAVLAYVAVISAMVVVAFASRFPPAVVPAALFFGSDILIAFRRFVSPRPWMPVAIMVTYHVGQLGLVLSLATG